MKKMFQIAIVVLALFLPLGLYVLRPHSQSPLPPVSGAPTNTPLAAASPTASPLPTTPTFTPSPVIFRDDFNGLLDPGWTWVNEDPKAWNLAAFPGFLQIQLSAGSVSSGYLTNMLLTPLPSGNVQVTTGFTFRGSENNQFAGLIFYRSGEDFLQVGRGFCRLSYPNCVRSGIYVQRFENGNLSLPNDAAPYSAYEPFFLRLARQGNKYSIETSGDGQAWYRFAEYALEFEPTHVGLIAGQNLGDPIAALFDFFEISQISE